MKKFIIPIIIITSVVALSVLTIIVADKFTGAGIGKKLESEIESFFKSDEPEEDPIDNSPLEVEIPYTEFTILEANFALPVISNKPVTLGESARLNMILAKEADAKKYYVVEVANIEIGKSEITIRLSDEAGNTNETKISVERRPYSFPLGLTEILPWPNYEYTVNPDNLLSILDKEHKIISGFEPDDLVDLNKDYLLYTNTGGSIMLRKEAAEYLSIMLNKLREETGKNLVIASGFRSYNDQVEIYSGWLRTLGQEEADKVSARPGFSEHHLGTVIDFVSDETSYDLTNEFTKTAAGAWINQNAYKYGFVKSYPEGKSEITGYSNEEWHWRYIGVENAKTFTESGLTLKEWLETMEK